MAPPPVNGQPKYAQPTATTRKPWSSGIFSCLSDIPSCCLTWYCPCIAFGRVADIVGKGSDSCFLCGGLYLFTLLTGNAIRMSYNNRKQLRIQYMLEGSAGCDCAIHTFCHPCGLSQEYRELKHRGFDMSLGWQGNMDKKNQNAKVPPFGQEGMTR